MKLTVVGSGTAAPDGERVSAGFWVEAAGTRVLLDCGPGVVHRLAGLGLPWPHLDHLVLSHFHNDHIGDLPMLLFALKWGVAERRTEPLVLWAPHGIRNRIRAMAAAFGDHVVEPGFPLIVRELVPGESVRAGPVALTTTATPHTTESLAFRLQHDGRTLGYTGDTGPSDDVAAFLAGCDLLLAECSLPDDAAKDTHLSPSSLAALASRAAPRHLVVTHVYPNLQALDPIARIREAGWTGPAIHAHDGLELEVGADAAGPPPMDDAGPSV